MMTSFHWVVVFVSSLSFMVVTFFGRLPALCRTPVAGLHKLICNRLPATLSALDKQLTAGRLSWSLRRFGNFMMHDRHPTVVVFFLAILVCAEYLFLPDAWPLMSWLSRLLAVTAVSLPYLFLFFACSADPGYITPDNHAYHMSLYPYDYTLFHPGNECRTCRLLKPARSKHCSICKHCVARADHHCIFINSCVGYGNHHWFLLLLFSTAFLTTYGGLLGLSLMSSLIQAHHSDWAIWKPRDMPFHTYTTIWTVGIQQNVRIGATSLLAILTSPLVWGLLTYTLYLVWAGTTTSESFKWSTLKDDMGEGCAFRRALLSARTRSSQTEPLCQRWPIEPIHTLVTTSNGQAPPGNAHLPGEGEWERVWRLEQVENLYDMGFWDNLADSFQANYSFDGGKDHLPNQAKRQN